MKYLYLVAFLALDVLGCVVTVRAQDVVVSEYRNDVSQDPEFTELLVVADNVDLRGFIVTDNRGEGDMRQSGPQFRDLDIFANVRAGTIILLWHGSRTSPQVTEDADPADGYMEFSQQDGRYFNIVRVDGGGSNTGMNLNQDRDFIQVLRADTSHVHGLGHGNPPGDTWDATPNPKTGSDTNSVAGSRSVGVTGRSLEAYNAPRGKDSVSVGLLATPGLPNSLDNPKILAGLTNRNKFFWLETREPKWASSPTMAAVATGPNTHELSWTNVIDPFPQDNVTGYMILRDTNNFVGFNENVIRDGQLFVAGERIGSAEVLVLRTTLQGATFSDVSNIKCGTSYTYRVYAYRFAADDQLGEAPDSTSRGRQYSPVFAQSNTITKQNPPTPTITASALQICPGDSVELTTDIQGNYTFEWMFNGVVFATSSQTTSPPRVTARGFGSYMLVVKGAGGCSAQSNTIEITSLPSPRVPVTPVGVQKICTGNSVTLETSFESSAYQWLRNGNAIPGATQQSYVASTPGDYQCRVESNEGCAGLSVVIPVQYFDIDVSFSEAELDFGLLGECQASKTRTIWLRNTGDETVRFTNINVPADFALVFPSVGFELRSGDSLQVTLRYAPTGSGLSTGVAVFTSIPCSSELTLNLRGTRNQAKVSLNRASVDFGSFSACAGADIRADSAFVVRNQGSDTITVRAPLVNPPFYLLTAFTSVKVAPNDSFEIRVQYRPFGADLDAGYSTDITFPYSSISCTDVLTASLNAASFIPKVELVETDLDLGVVLGCVGTADTVVTIRNTSVLPVRIVANRSASVAVAGLPLDIPPGEERSVRATLTTSGTGAFSIRDTLVSDACGTRLPLEFSGIVFRASFSATPTVVDVGEVSLCSPQPATNTFVLRATGTNGLRSPILVADVSAPFSVDVLPGVTITDSIVVTATYNPSIAGADEQTAVFVFGPCNDTVRVVLRGATTENSRSTLISDADFGTLLPGETSVRTLRIVNTGTSPITVEPLEGVAAPWQITSSVPTLPANLNPLDSVVVELTYSYVSPSRDDEMVLRSTTSGPCADTVEYTLTGATAPADAPAQISLSLPASTVAKVGTTVSIPFALTSAESLQGRGITTITSFISYNGTLMLPTSATSDFASVQVVETTPGKARIEAVFTTEATRSAETFVLNVSTFVGNAPSTTIVLDSVITSGYTIQGNEGELILEGSCGVTTQVVEFGEPPSITVHGNTESTISIDFVTVSNAPTTISVVSMNGETVYQQQLVVRPGKHTMRIPSALFSSGTYVFAMHHDIIQKSTTSVITR